MNFRQDDLPVGRIERSVETLERSGAFHADTLVVDGYDFARASVGDVEEIRDFARRKGYEVWMSASTAAPADNEVPRELRPFSGQIAVIVGLKPADGRIRLHLVKDHDEAVPSETRLELDPGILLISGA
jgi:hypothetical protein